MIKVHVDCSNHTDAVQTSFTFECHPSELLYKMAAGLGYQSTAQLTAWCVENEMTDYDLSMVHAHGEILKLLLDCHTALELENLLTEIGYRVDRIKTT